ncbi:hypothetical protein C8R44DRAFT_973482 [Mycena epipterygia]|nr:hypothetical protein C8R44DRAFT_973482 [Mycena epipterygia]
MQSEAPTAEIICGTCQSAFYPDSWENLPSLLNPEHPIEHRGSLPLARTDPFQHIPAELLIEIFDMCTPLVDGEVDGLCDTTTPDQEVERLAKSYLLQLSQVCARWHSIAMETPALWSMIVVDTTLWGGSSVPAGMLIGLVAAALERGGSHPLDIQAAVDDEDLYGRVVLELLSRHAMRWRRVYFWNGLPSHISISAAKGNLPLLEKLELSNQNDAWTELNVFEVAPQLTKVLFTGWAGKIPAFPWEQLQHFECTNILENDLADTLALLRHLSAGAHCQLTLDVCDFLPPGDLPHIVSDIFSLHIVLTAKSIPITVIGAVLACLTLPFLGQLELAGELDEPPLVWHQSHFLDFAARSDLHVHLTSLVINKTLITDADLLQCLAGLPLLEQLIAADCEGEDAVHVVITDELLQGLRSVAPRLDFVCLTSLLHFTDAVYWEFVTERLAPDDATLEIKIYWLPRRTRELTPEFFARAEELEAQGLTYTTGLDPDYIYD